MLVSRLLTEADLNQMFTYPDGSLEHQDACGVFGAWATPWTTGERDAVAGACLPETSLSSSTTSDPLSRANAWRRR